MPSIARSCLLLAALVAPAVRAAAPPPATADCYELLPQVLNVGLPASRRLSAAGFQSVQKAAEGLFKKFYDDNGRCAGQRRLQVNIAIGNDYQILDWLGQGLVDMAVIPDLTLYLLGRDGVELREVQSLDGRAGDLLTPATASRLRSRGYGPGGWTERPDPAGDFERFRWQLWCGAIAGPPAGRCSAMAKGPEHRIALASHLSTAGFLRPVADTARWLAARRAEAGEEDETVDRQRTDAFWTAFFQHARFTFGGDLPEGTRPTPGLVEIASEEIPASADGPPLRDHLVITAKAAEPLFRPEAFKAMKCRLPAELAALLSDPPAAFLPMLSPEPYFGVRTFGFTVEEGLGLLRQHQATTGRARLALVLPGGGVKSVYQSRLLDALYGAGYLKNSLTQSLPTASASPLNVDYVIGTSGGALLGYFVSRLAEKGPWTLSEVLWRNGTGQVLDSTDIFGWTDLPRYLTVIAIFGVFAGLLTIASMVQRSHIPVSWTRRETAVRWRLALAVWPLLLAIPLLVRWVNGEHSQEHIPVVEGLFYALCASLVMFADQCLIHRQEERREGEPWLHFAWPLALGSVLVALPLLAPRGVERQTRWIDHDEPLLDLSWRSLLICSGVLVLLVAAVFWVTGRAATTWRRGEASGPASASACSWSSASTACSGR